MTIILRSAVIRSEKKGYHITRVTQEELLQWRSKRDFTMKTAFDIVAPPVNKVRYLLDGLMFLCSFPFLMSFYYIDEEQSDSNQNRFIYLQISDIKQGRQYKFQLSSIQGNL